MVKKTAYEQVRDMLEAGWSLEDCLKSLTFNGNQAYVEELLERLELQDKQLSTAYQQLAYYEAIKALNPEQVAPE